MLTMRWIRHSLLIRVKQFLSVECHDHFEPVTRILSNSDLSDFKWNFISKFLACVASGKRLNAFQCYFIHTLSLLMTWWGWREKGDHYYALCSSTVSNIHIIDSIVIDGILKPCCNWWGQFRRSVSGKQRDRLRRMEKPAGRDVFQVWIW